MTVGDADLLSSTRAGDRPPASVWAVLAAVRSLTEAGKVLTTEGLGEQTGYDRATLYRAREWLDTHQPTWRPDAPASNGNGHAPGVELELVVAAAVVADIVEAVVAPAIAPPKTNGARCLLWRDAIARRHQAVAGRRTWDLFVDIYSPAADELFAAGNIGDLIALTVDYVETVLGGKVTAAERKRIAQVTRIHGKAIIYGMQEGLSRTSETGCDAAITYATAVARATHRKLRGQEATA